MSRTPLGFIGAVIVVATPIVGYVLGTLVNNLVSESLEMRASHLHDLNPQTAPSSNPEAIKQQVAEVPYLNIIRFAVLSVFHARTCRCCSFSHTGGANSGPVSGRGASETKSGLHAGQRQG